VFIQKRQDNAIDQPRSQALGPAFRRYGAWITLGALLLGLLIGFPLLALLPLAIYAGMLALERADCPAAAFVLWGFTLVCLVCLGTEIVYIRDVFEGSSSRMNTIFKFYYQAWLIWGVLAGYAAWWLFARWNVPTFKRSNVTRVALIVLTFLFAVGLTGALVYPWLTAGKVARTAEWSSIAGVTPRENTPDGMAGIEWLRANTPGNAVVLEAVGDSYDSGYSGLGFGQVSGSTGRPTVLGWPGHEDQWRGGDPAAQAQIGPRKADVTTIYSDTDITKAAELLKKYSVDYIYVGAAERATYPAEGLAKLGQLGDPVFQQGEVAIYKVK
jgi:YYY domain-containing protein